LPVDHYDETLIWARSQGCENFSTGEATQTPPHRISAPERTSGL